MAYLKLQQFTSVPIAPSDDARIPLPSSPHFSGLVIDVPVGTTTEIDALLTSSLAMTAGSGVIVGQGNSGGVLVVDAAATFVTDGVQALDTFQNDTTNQSGRVYYVVSETELVLYGNDVSLATVGDAYFVISRNNFSESGVKVGDIIVNNNTLESTTINRMADFRTVRLTTNIFGAPPPSVPYSVYTQPDANLGCILYVGGQGDLNVITSGGETALFQNVPEGIWSPVQVIQVLAADTTATDLVANW